MNFFRSPTLRRIIYAVAFGLALLRFAATRSHSEPLPVDDAEPHSGVVYLIH
jgi:hypothetical protein